MYAVSELTTQSGIRLHYQVQGSTTSPIVILIMGLGAQMTVWPDSLISSLVEQGFCVVRFDNRDVGLSSKLEEHGRPSLIAQELRQRFHISPNPPYTLDDMAQDVIDLMDGLNIEKAHIVGASMGGMIGQIIAANHKKRCVSLVSLMSSSGNPKLPKARLKVWWQLLKQRSLIKPKCIEEAAIEQTIQLNKVMNGATFPMSESDLRRLAKTNVRRSYHPSGFSRQLAALRVSGNRVSLLKKIKVPTLVIHGSDDPVIPIQAALDTAVNIPKAKFRIIHGMGHNIPNTLSKQLGKLIGKHVRKAETKATAKKNSTSEDSDQRRNPRMA